VCATRAEEIRAIDSRVVLEENNTRGSLVWFGTSALMNKKDWGEMIARRSSS